MLSLWADSLALSCFPSLSFPLPVGARGGAWVGRAIGSDSMPAHPLRFPLVPGGFPVFLHRKNMAQATHLLRFAEVVERFAWFVRLVC